MIKRSFSIALLPIVTVLSLHGCDDDSKTAIVFASPTDGQTFSIGDTIDVKATLTSATEAPLHGYEVRIRDLSDESEVFEAEEHTHGATIDIDESWVVTVSDTRLEIEVVSVNDHDGNTDRRTIEVRVD